MWKVAALHIDGSLEWQPGLLSHCDLQVDLRGGHVSGGNSLSLIAQREQLSRLASELWLPPKCVVFMGGGGMHHLTLALIEHQLVRQGLAGLHKSVDVVVFDRHKDFFCAPDGFVTCGSWIRDLVGLKEVGRVYLIGPAERPSKRPEDQLTTKKGGALGLEADDLLAGKVVVLSGEDWCELLRSVRQLCTQKKTLYLSVDKDVFCELDTDWGSGVLSVRSFGCLLHKVAFGCNILGVDVCGEVTPRGVWPTRAELAAIRRSERMNLYIVRLLRSLGARQKERKACVREDLVASAGRGEVSLVSSTGAARGCLAN